MSEEKDQLKILFDELSDDDDMPEEKESNMGNVFDDAFRDVENKPESKNVFKETEEPVKEDVTEEVTEEDEEDLYEDEEDKEDASPKKSLSYKTSLTIFTIVVVALTLIAIVLILYKRGVIFSDTKPTTPSQTVIPSSDDPSSSENPSSSEDPTDPSVSSSEDPTEPSQSADVVLSHYTNLFVITNDTVNMRGTPSTDAPIVAILHKDFGGEVLGLEGDWYHVTSGGIEGYIRSDLLVTGDEAKNLAPLIAKKLVKITGESGVNVRAQATTDAVIVAQAAYGSTWEYVAIEGKFYKISLSRTEGNLTGYVSRDYSDYSYYLEEAIRNGN